MLEEEERETITCTFHRIRCSVNSNRSPGKKDSRGQYRGNPYSESKFGARHIPNWTKRQCSTEPQFEFRFKPRVGSGIRSSNCLGKPSGTLCGYRFSGVSQRRSIEPTHTECAKVVCV